jgi:NADH-quinone oxidoreductase subunit H
MISYEVSIGIILIATLLPVGSLNLTQIVYFQETIWLIIPQFGLFLLFFISSLAETNRAPFDLPEAEAELVSGYNVEYSAMGFALFFLAEYSNIIITCVLTTIIFFGGWISPLFLLGNTLFFVLKILFLLIVFIWVRTTFPRFSMIN